MNRFHCSQFTVNSLRGRAEWTATILLALLMTGLFGAGSWLQHKYHLTKERVQTVKPFRVGHLPSGKYIRVAAFGYDVFLAHALWLRAIQSFGGLFRSPGQNYTQILSQFDVISDLEPRFYDAYDFGSMVIGEEAHEHELALQLIDKGMVKNQRRYYKLAYAGLFHCAWNIKDYKRAAYYCRMAQKCRDCPEWVKGVAIWLESQQGRMRLAFEKWFEDYLAHLDRGDAVMSNIRLIRVRSQLRDIGLQILNDALQRFSADQGRPARSLNELLDNQYLNAQEHFSWSKLEAQIQEYTNRGEPLAPKTREMLDRALLKGNVLPENPRHPGSNGFLLSQLDGKAYAYEELESICRGRLKLIRDEIEVYVRESGRYPQALTDMVKLVDETGNLRIKEPVVLNWVYDVQMGVVKSSTFPHL